MEMFLGRRGGGGATADTELVFFVLGSTHDRLESENE